MIINILDHTPSALHETYDNWTFEIGEYNKNNGKFNIYCIHKNKTTEIQIIRWK